MTTFKRFDQNASEHDPEIITVSLDQLREHLMTLDDFLLTFAPSDETGQFDNLSTLEHAESGIADGTPIEDCYRRLFENTVVEFVRLTREINKVLGVKIIDDGDGREPYDGGQFKQSGE